MKTKIIERRKHDRVKSEFPIEFSVYKPDEQAISLKNYTGKTKDISEDGLCVEFNELDHAFSEWLKSNYIFKVGIRTPYLKSPIESKVTIVWRVTEKNENGSHKHLIGMQFKSLNEDLRHKLYTFAKRNHWQKTFIILTFFLTGFLIYLIFHSSH